ncbi:MAG: hypothetical protein K0S65_6437 [Labilithrix sp.]|nr:hypothetical protein [Labilithrix sp.]
MSKLLAPILVTVIHLAALGACSPESSGLAESTATVHVAPTSTVVVNAEVGELTSRDVPVSGRDRQAVPDTDDWWCGYPLRSTSISNITWLQLLNASEDTLGLSVELDGLPKTQPKLYVYAKKEAPLHDCVTLGPHRKLGGATSIVIEPRSSAYLLVSAGAATGVYTVSIKTEHVIEP